MNTSDRIKELREYLGLSQREFSNKINIGQSTLAMFETGQRILKDIHISQICSEFNTNEEWLRFGKGEMFIETKETFLSELSKKHDLDELDQVILESYLALNKGQRNGVKDFFRFIAKSLADEETAVSISIDEELEKYRLELEAEQKGEILSVLEDPKEKLN